MTSFFEPRKTVPLKEILGEEKWREYKKAMAKQQKETDAYMREQAALRARLLHKPLFFD